MEDKTMRNEVHFKIGLDGVEFDAKGDSAFIERERNAFEAKLLPLGVDAVTRTRGTPLPVQYIESAEQPPMLLPSENNIIPETTSPTMPTSDLSRTSLTAFLNVYGVLSEQDFVLFAAFFYEKKNNVQVFTSESVKQFYTDARRTKVSNNSDLLQRLAKKGYIMDAPNAEQKVPKQYVLSSDGLQYIEKYIPKIDAEKKATKPRKSRPKAKSTYADINCDELNLGNYPEVKALKDFKEKMMMVLYIITNEGKGE